MNTKIYFTYKDVPYTLEYNRDSVKKLEAVGFNIKDFMASPMTNIELAFKGAFLKNHRKTNDSLIDEIYANMGNKEALLEKLIAMIEETYDTLFDEKDKGNIEWDTQALK